MFGSSTTFFSSLIHYVCLAAHHPSSLIHYVCLAARRLFSVRPAAAEALRCGHRAAVPSMAGHYVCSDDMSSHYACSDEALRSDHRAAVPSMAGHYACFSLIPLPSTCHTSPSLPRVTLLTPFHVSQPHGATRTPRESNLSYGDESESDASFALAHSLQATTTTATTTAYARCEI